MRHARRLALSAVAVASVGTLAGAGVSGLPTTAVTRSSSAPSLAQPGGDADEAVAPVVADLPRDHSSAVSSVRANGKSARIDFRALPRTKPVKSERTEPPKPLKVGSGKPGGGGTSSGDVLAQKTTSTAAPFTLAANFEGMNYTDNGAGHPPDTSGAAGPDAFVQTVNTSIAIYGKSGSTLAAPVTFDTFWAAAHTGTACDNANYGDPFVLFDHVTRRWVIADFTVKSPYLQCFAVSDVQPTSGADVAHTTWHFFAVTVSTTDLGDYPKGAFRNGVLYLSANMFRNGQTFAGAKVWAFDLSQASAGSISGIYATTGTSYGSLLPANSYTSDGATDNWFVSLSTAGLQFWKLSPAFLGGANTFTTSPTLLTVPAYTRASSVTEPQPGESLDALSDRLMYQLQLANGHLYVNHSVQSGTTAGVRWYDVDVSGTAPRMADEGTYALTDGGSRWMGSAAVDKKGNLAVGYSVIRGNNAGSYPGIAVAGRVASGTLSTETMIQRGGGVQVNGYNRWGDYSQMSLDPTDGCTLWYTQEYMGTTSNNWQTRVASLKFPSCT